jgi:hypothetical protein
LAIVLRDATAEFALESGDYTKKFPVFWFN